MELFQNERLLPFERDCYKNKKQAMDWEKIFAKHEYLSRFYNNAIIEGKKNQLKIGEVFE